MSLGGNIVESIFLIWFENMESWHNSWDIRPPHTNISDFFLIWIWEETKQKETP